MMKPDFKKWVKKEHNRDINCSSTGLFFVDEINQFAEEYGKQQFNEGFDKATIKMQISNQSIFDEAKKQKAIEFARWLDLLDGKYSDYEFTVEMYQKFEDDARGKSI